MSKKPVIRSVRAYQAVSFDKANETTFIANGTQRKAKVEITINSELNGVEIKSATDHILIPITNISCIYYESPSIIANDEAKEKEAKRVKAQDAKQVDRTKKPR